MLSRPLASAIIVLVSLVWAANFIAQFVIPEYKPDVTLNGVFMAIVGGALALSRKDNNDKGDNGGAHAKRRDPDDPGDQS
jgi:hypothetical protein